MVQLTFGEQQAYPRFWLSVPADQDVKTQSEVIADLVDRGLEVGQDYVRDMLGIPVPAAGEAVLRPKTTLSGSVGVGQNASRGLGPYKKTYSNRSLIRALQMGEPLAIPETAQEEADRISRDYRSGFEGT
jgi:phage gp29-like protein